MPVTGKGKTSPQPGLPLSQALRRGHHDPGSLRRRFEQTVGRPVTLTLTENSSSIFSIRARDGGLSMRIHSMFLEAGDDVLKELAEYVRGRKGKTPLFWKFVRARSHCLNKKPPRKVTPRTVGRHHDLGEIFQRLNHGYFGGRLNCLVTWGAYRPGRPTGKRTLGSYSARTDTIRISPALDSGSVPWYFVEFVLYHEMLHARMGVERKNGRRSIHSKEFRGKERLFGQYDRAVAWEKNGMV